MNPDQGPADVATPGDADEQKAPDHARSTGSGTRARNASAGQVDDELLATYTAAKGFLIGEWFGALLMVASFTQLYWLVFSQAASARTTLLLGAALMALGSVVFWRSRVYYHRLDFPWKKRWETMATVVAGSGVFFWLLFAFLVVLDARGVKLL